MEQFDKSEISELALDLKGYFYLLWSWAWLIVLAGVLAGATAFIMSKRMTPIYAASAQLLVSAPSTVSGVDPSGGTSIYTLTTTYTQMLTDPSVLQGAIDQLQLKTTPEDLAGSISVKNIANTQLLQITATATDPQQAADIANAVATVFVARVQDLRSQRYATIREGLSSQLTNMEQLISTTSDQIAAVDEEMAAAAAQKAAIVGTQLAVAATQTVTAMEPPGAAAATQTVIAVQQQISVSATQTAAAAPATVIPPVLVQLQDRLTQYRTVYSNLVQSYEQVRMAEEQASSNVVVSQEARINLVPVVPKTSQYTLIAALAGALLAAGVVFMVENLDDTIRSPDEIRRNAKLPILGVILRHKVKDGKPVILATPLSLASEAFRSLRTNIRFATVNRPLRRVLITSPTPQDGKTTVASNLAVVFSQNEKRVILVDADLRKPKVHHEFGLQNQVGLSDLLVRPLDGLGSVVQAVNPLQLAVLTSGSIPPNPAELITSHLMSEILDALDRDFDMVVIDTPPLLIVTDAAALAPSVDGVILVAKPGTTKASELKQALRQLHAVGAPVLGLVLNDVNPSNRRYGYYYSEYGSRYSHYYHARRGLGSLLGGGATRKKHRSAPPPRAITAEAEGVATEPDAVVLNAEAAAAEVERVAMGPEATVPEPEAIAAGVQGVATEPIAVATEPDSIVARPQLAAVSPGPRRLKRAREGRGNLKVARTKHPRGT